jgi:hypothetical protein
VKARGSQFEASLGKVNKTLFQKQNLKYSYGHTSCGSALAWLLQGPGFNPQYSKKSQKLMFFIYLFIYLFFIFFIIHLFTCAYIVWVISPPCPPSTLSYFPPSVPGSSCSAFITSFVEEKIQA